MPAEDQSKVRVLVLARNYPNPALPVLGLWTRRLVACTTPRAEVKVVAPVPYAPTLVERMVPHVAPYRHVPRRRWDGSIEVFHPRLLVGPGQSSYALEGVSYAAAVLPTVRRLRRDFPFDVIHAHFTYPDGLAAVLLGRLYGVPSVITEHSLWLPWIRRFPLVQRQATWVASACDGLIGVSRAVQQHIGEVTGDSSKVRVIPNVVDADEFDRAGEGPRTPGQILFVGIVRHAKGLDVLLRALPRIRQLRPDVRLKLVGDPFYRAYRRDGEQLDELADTLGLRDCIEHLGQRSPSEVAELMRQSQVVVLPSRRESFGTVLIEALACGTPVVATRCGGPEDVVTPDVGELVQPDDPAALAAAILAVLDRASAYAPRQLRQKVLAQFGAPVVGEQILDEYDRVLRSPSAWNGRGRRANGMGLEMAAQP